ncbi:hypothetical protein GGR52DRAFT_16327 [Hypoxylon sp. FL1284]|nr:hypothetical protein GGR52DRAFT_16327 [Hypoxylon sp. FL1284]
MKVLRGPKVSDAKGAILTCDICGPCFCMDSRITRLRQLLLFDERRRLQGCSRPLATQRQSDAKAEAEAERAKVSRPFSIAPPAQQPALSSSCQVPGYLPPPAFLLLAELRKLRPASYSPCTATNCQVSAVCQPSGGKIQVPEVGTWVPEASEACVTRLTSPGRNSAIPILLQTINNHPNMFRTLAHPITHFQRMFCFSSTDTILSVLRRPPI